MTVAELPADSVSFDEFLDRTWHIEAQVDKYHERDFRRALRPDCVRRLLHRRSPLELRRRRGAVPYDTVVVPGNLMVKAGIDRLLDLLIGAGGTAYNNANSRIGVGNSSTAAANTQTDLQAAAGAANRFFMTMDATFPSRSAETVTWRVTVGTGDGNFAWAEWCVDNGNASGTTVTAPMLNRKVSALGTKVAGAIWQFTVTATPS